jgi:hypothetical protein
VTFGSMENLTNRFVTNRRVAADLIDHLRDAEKDRTRGKRKQAEQELSDYRHDVLTQVGRSITRERGFILIALSLAL